MISHFRVRVSNKLSKLIERSIYEIPCLSDYIVWKHACVFGKSERAASPVEKFFGGWGPQPRKLDSDPAAYMPERQSFCGSCLRFTVEGNFWDCQGPQPLTFNPALTTCASERMKTFRFSYFAGFAAQELMREAKPVKTRKSGDQPLFRQ